MSKAKACAMKPATAQDEAMPASATGTAVVPATRIAIAAERPATRCRRGRCLDKRATGMSRRAEAALAIWSRNRPGSLNEITASS